MQNSSDRFRSIVKVWLFVSLVGVAWNLVPVFAKYSLDQQKLADLEERRRNPPKATVHVAEDSPWPGSTILMQGQPVEGLDDSQFPGGQIQYGQMARTLVTHRSVSLIQSTHKTDAKLLQSIPEGSNGESLFAAAISGDGKVIATVGEFTQVSFWNAATGALLQTVEEEFPTAAAEPDNSARGNKHPNGLRYSNMGIRKLVAAPGGCLFAIGKVDGFVELWTAEGQELPDRPSGMVTADWPYRPDDLSDPPNRFRRLHRIQLHEGEVRQLEFSQDCRSLVSVSGRRFLKMQPVDGPEGIASYTRPAYEKDTTPTVVKTEVVSGTIQWQVDLDSHPQTMTLDQNSQQNIKGLLRPPQLAIALDNQNISVMSLDDGSVLNTFSSRYGKSRIRCSSLAFGNGGSPLWTVGTRHAAGEEHHSYTSVSAWDAIRGKRVATAEVPGQVMASAWNEHGTQLATIRYFSNLPSDSKHVPWVFHLWEMKIDQAKPSAEASASKIE